MLLVTIFKHLGHLINSFVRKILSSTMGLSSTGLSSTIGVSSTGVSCVSMLFSSIIGSNSGASLLSTISAVSSSLISTTVIFFFWHDYYYYIYTFVTSI